MADVLTGEQRRLNMSRIRGKDTKPEMIIRKGLHSRGYRYRLHVRNLPGHPDLVFPRYNAIIFVNGCFWHGHMCPLFKWPSTRKDFWEEKIFGNIERDRRNLQLLSDIGWRVIIIWECSLKGKNRFTVQDVLDRVEGFFISSEIHLVEISGKE